MKIKKIGAILAGAFMIGSALAAAWNPVENEDFFVDPTTGQPNVIVVAGENAADKDVTGAAWIAAQIGSMCQKVEMVPHVESAEWDSGIDYQCSEVYLTNTSPFSWNCNGYNTSGWDLDSLFWNDCDLNKAIECDEPKEFISLNLSWGEGVYPCIAPFGEKLNWVDIVHKEDLYWSIIDDPENGTLQYSLNFDGMLTYNYNKEIPGYELVVIMAETSGIPGSEWPQTGSVELPDTNSNPNIESGQFDISAQLGNVNDGADYDGSVYGAKIWYVPEIYFNEVAGEFEMDSYLHFDEFLFEVDLITPTGVEGLAYGTQSNVSNRCTIEVATPGCPSCPTAIQGIFYFPECDNDMRLFGETYQVLDSFIDPIDYTGYKDEAILFGKPTMKANEQFVLGESPHVYADGWEVTLEDINLAQTSLKVTINNPKYNVHESQIIEVNDNSIWDYGEFYVYNEDLLAPGDWNYAYEFTPAGLESNYKCSVDCDGSKLYEGTTIFSLVPRHVFMGYNTKQAVMDVYTLEDAWTLDDECCLNPCGENGNWWNLTVKNQSSLDCKYQGEYEYLMNWPCVSCVTAYDVGVFMTLQESLCVTEGPLCEHGKDTIRVPLCEIDPRTVEAYDVATDPEEPYFTVFVDDYGDDNHYDMNIEKGVKIRQDIHYPDEKKITPVVINPMDICKLDSEITVYDKQFKNLILIGGPGFVDVTELPANTITQEVYQARYSIDWFTSEGEYQYLSNVFADGVDVLIVAGKDRDATRLAVFKLLEDMDA